MPIISNSISTSIENITSIITITNISISLSITINKNIVVDTSITSLEPTYYSWKHQGCNIPVL